MKTIGILLLACASACSWGTFDDLKDSTWVTATDKPDNDSSNWGVAIQRGQASGAGGRLVVIGANQALYSELVVATNGDISVPSTTLELNSMFGIGNLDAQPILIADPASNDVAFVTPAGGSIAVLRGAMGVLAAPYQLFGAAMPDAATFMVSAMGQQSRPLVAEGDKVYGTFLASPMNPPTSCKLTDDVAAPALVRALGATPHPAMDGRHNVLVWASSGKLMRFPPDVFDGAGAPCMTGRAPGAGAFTSTTFMPEKGSQILTFETGTGRFAVLQGHNATGGGFLALYDVNAMMLVGSAASASGIKSAALMELAGKRYVVAGFPDANVKGTSGAGQVQVFEVDPLSGVNGSAVMTLHDAQPEGDQAFGRSVTVMPFDGDPLIVVAADNEVFTYFRTTLYGETR